MQSEIPTAMQKAMLISLSVMLGLSVKMFLSIMLGYLVNMAKVPWDELYTSKPTQTHNFQFIL
jgi:hypothetical protein